MSLETRKRTYANEWVKLPITNEEIDDAHDLADNHYLSLTDDTIDI